MSNQSDLLTERLKELHASRGTPEHSKANALVEACARNCTDDDQRVARTNFIHGDGYTS